MADGQEKSSGSRLLRRAVARWGIAEPAGPEGDGEVPREAFVP